MVKNKKSNTNTKPAKPLNEEKEEQKRKSDATAREMLKVWI